MRFETTRKVLRPSDRVVGNWDNDAQESKKGGTTNTSYAGLSQIRGCRLGNFRYVLGYAVKISNAKFLVLNAQCLVNETLKMTPRLGKTAPMPAPEFDDVRGIKRTIRDRQSFIQQLRSHLQDSMVCSHSHATIPYNSARRAIDAYRQPSEQSLSRAGYIGHRNPCLDSEVSVQMVPAVTEREGQTCHEFVGRSGVEPYPLSMPMRKPQFNQATYGGASPHPFFYVN